MCAFQVMHECVFMCTNKSSRKSSEGRRRRSICGRLESLGVLSWNRSQQALACQIVLYIHIRCWRHTIHPKAEAQLTHENIGGEMDAETDRGTCSRHARSQEEGVCFL